MQGSPENPWNRRGDALEALTGEIVVPPAHLTQSSAPPTRGARLLRWYVALELHRWRGARAGLGLEVVVVPVEAQHTGKHIVRE